MTNLVPSAADALTTRTAEVVKYTYHLFSSRDDDPVVIFLYDERSDSHHPALGWPI